MVLSAREVAEAFSGHRFEDAFPYLADRVVWRMPGSDGIERRDAVVAACRSTAAELVGTQVEVERFLVVDGGDKVAIDTVTSYGDGSDHSVVASCGIYEFRGELIVQIGLAGRRATDLAEGDFRRPTAWGWMLQIAGYAFVGIISNRS